jgi:WD repeat-containing protein 70
MGISSFGCRKAKTFDIEEMMATAKKHAPKAIEDVETADAENDAEGGDDLIGPMIPVPTAGPSKEQQKKEKKKKESKNDGEEHDSYDDLSDSDEDDDSDDSDEDTLISKIPCSHEITMQHGSKAVIALSADASGARLGMN